MRGMGHETRHADYSRHAALECGHGKQLESNSSKSSYVPAADRSVFLILECY